RLTHHILVLALILSVNTLQPLYRLGTMLLSLVILLVHILTVMKLLFLSVHWRYIRECRTCRYRTRREYKGRGSLYPKPLRPSPGLLFSRGHSGWMRHPDISYRMWHF